MISFKQLYYNDNNKKHLIKFKINYNNNKMKI